MLKSSTGTERSVHTTTCASTAVAEALLIESRVLTPFGLPKSTSKYGSSSVAAGTSSTVHRMAWAGTDAKAAAISRTTVSFLMRAPPWESSQMPLVGESRRTTESGESIYRTAEGVALTPSAEV